MLPIAIVRRFETPSHAVLITGGSGKLRLSHDQGGKDRRRGQPRHEVVSSANAAQPRCATIAQRRQQHGDPAVAD